MRFVSGMITMFVILVVTGLFTAGISYRANVPDAKERAHADAWWKLRTPAEQADLVDFLDVSKVDSTFGGFSKKQREWLKMNVRLWQMQMGQGCKHVADLVEYDLPKIRNVNAKPKGMKEKVTGIEAEKKKKK